MLRGNMLRVCVGLSVCLVDISDLALFVDDVSDRSLSDVLQMYYSYDLRTTNPSISG